MDGAPAAGPKSRPLNPNNRLIIHPHSRHLTLPFRCTQWHTACFDCCRIRLPECSEPWRTLLIDPLWIRNTLSVACCIVCRSGPCVTETVAAIVAAHRAGHLSPAQTVARSFARIREHNDPAVFISLRDEKDAIAEAEALSAKNAAQLPLYGIPVGVKDNIDAAGLPTTAACPAFSYDAKEDATVVGRLRHAGRVLGGET